MAAILNSSILDSDTAIFDSKKNLYSFILRLNLMMAAILNFTISGFRHFAQKKTSLIHSHLIMMMAAILNSAILN